MTNTPATEHLPSDIPADEDLERRHAALYAHWHARKLQRQALRQRRLHNEMALVACLHADVLTEVFIQLALTSMFERGAAEDSGGKPYEWLRVMWVCHSWREVALASPRLWNNILLTNSVPLMRMMLARSKQTPIHLDTEPSPQVLAREVWDLVFANLSRIGTLAMAVADVLKPAVAIPPVASKLTHFCLIHGPSVPPATPNLIEQCVTPHLSYLSLHRVSVSWKSPIFRDTLTHLIITSPKPPHTKLPLTKALGGMPFLEHLVLTCFSRMLSIPQAPGQPVLHLPRLRFLKLGDTARHCGHFLSHVVHPTSTQIVLSIRFTDETSVYRESRAIRNAITPIPEIGPPGIPGLVFTPHYQGHGGLRAVLLPPERPLEELVAASLHRSDEDSLIDITVHFSDRVRVGLDCLRELLPIRRTKTLCANVSTAYVPTLRMLPPSLPEVEELILKQHGAWSIPELLSLRYLQLRTNRQSASVSCFFPEVKRLVLSHVKFRDHSGCISDDSQAKAYAEMLATRKEGGSMVEELVLHKCINLTAKDVAALEVSVGRVTWDPATVEWTKPPPPADRVDVLGTV